MEIGRAMGILKRLMRANDIVINIDDSGVDSDLQATIALSKLENGAIQTIIKEVELKNKIIDLMAEQLTSPINGVEWVKKYYEERAREDL